jgi:hypothetical protein
MCEIGPTIMFLSGLFWLECVKTRTWVKTQTSADQSDEGGLSDYFKMETEASN